MDGNEHFDARLAQIEHITDPLGRLTQFGDAYADFALNNRRLFHALMMGDGDQRTPSRSDGVELSENSRLSGMIEDVRAAMADGSIAPGSPELVALMLWMTMHGAVALLISLPGYPFPSEEFTLELRHQFTANALQQPFMPDFEMP